MSNNSTPEASHRSQRGLLLLPGAKTGRPRPAQITRSVSEIPPSPHAPYGDEHKPASPAPRLHDSITSLDVFSPMGRPGIFSSSSSPGVSRRASILMGAAPAMVDEAPAGPPLGVQSSRKGSDETKGVGGRQNVEKTVTGLKQCIVDLSDLSSDTTRLLDDTYTSVLEKMGALQNTILGLRELALQSQNLAETFEKEAAQVEAEVEMQIQDFDDFREQEQRIEVLRRRVEGGRDKISSLGRRVDVVRDMVEGWERADKEWQERTRRRLMVIWGITSAVIFALALLFYAAQYRGSRSGEPLDRVSMGMGEGGGGDANVSFNWPSAEGVGVKKTGATGLQAFPGAEGTRAPEAGEGDERLRLFDEL